MFRISPFIYHSRIFLYHRKALDMQLASISFTPNYNLQAQDVLEREKCPPPPPPPPPPPRDLRLLYGVVAMAVLTGSFTVFAKKNPEVRDWLSIHAPWFDDFIAFAYQENMTYQEFAIKSSEDAAKYASKLLENEPKKCTADGKPIFVVPVSRQNPENEESVMRSVDEIHCCIKSVGEKLVKKYKLSNELCLKYNKLVEEIMVFFDMESIKELESAMADRQAKIKKALTTESEDIKKFDQLRHYFDCGVKGTPEELDRTRNMISQLSNTIKSTRNSFLESEAKSEALDRLWTTVRDTVSNYVMEAEHLFPGLDYKSKKPQMTGDTDMLLYHTERNIKQLEKELDESSVTMTRRINRNLALFPEDPKKPRDSDIMKTYNQKKADMEKEYSDRTNALNAKNEKALKDALEDQKQKHEELLANRMKEKELEVTKKLDKMVDEMLGVERKKMGLELEELRKRFKEIEDKLNVKLQAEKASKRSQILYAAGAALLAATKKGSSVVKVDKELKVIQKVAKDDKLVSTVLNTIPENIWKEGVVPESTLRKKYHSMEKVALRVALVEQEGAPLHVYIISLVQSLLLFLKLPGIPQNEVENVPKELVKHMDTFDILQRARFWVERGEFSKAVHYVQSLQGASLAAAYLWYKAAREHLELRQAIDALQAHAASLALTYV